VNFSFRRATKHAAKLRLAFVGPAGSGKTFSSLAVATALGGKIAVIDSERGSASKYADIFEFDVLELESFAPEMFVQAIRVAEAAGYDTIIIDSLSHAWMGREGALEQVDGYARKSGGAGNNFAAWRHVTPKHNTMVDALVGSKCHVIATMRSKTEWVVEKDKNGKSVPRKIGLAPVQRDGLEYEFDVVGDLDIENTFTVTKTRCPALAGKLVERPGAQIAEVLNAWLEGVPRPVEASKPAPAAATESSNVLPMQQPEPMQQLDATPATDELERRLRECTSAQELGALVAELKRMPEGEAKDRMRAVYEEVRASRRKASTAAQEGAA
jgi:hypothetical protein